MTAGEARRTLGRYQLIRKLGRGGMANVYLAELSGDHGFAKMVAIKTIHPQRAHEPRFVSMFLEEMRVASRLSHPNVCAVLDFGMEDETPYLVMEHLDGYPLSAVMRLDDRGLPRDIAARVVADAARGLHAAHELASADGKIAGIVHRDVSPQNLMLLHSGVTKVLDFGIAKASDPSGSITSSHPKGKVRYMAPEQLGGTAVDRRADIWPLGVILWEATLGRRLFGEGHAGGAAAASVMSKGIARPSSIDPDYPAALEDVVMSILRRNPERRPKTAGDVADALEAYLYSLGKPCGAGQISAWLATHMLDPNTEPSTASTTDPRAQPAKVEAHVAAAPAPSSATLELGSETFVPATGLLGPDVADLATEILPPSETPTPGPVVSTATERTDAPAETGDAAFPRTSRARWLVAGAIATVVVGTTLGLSVWGTGWLGPRDTHVGERVASPPSSVSTSPSVDGVPIRRSSPSPRPRGEGQGEGPPSASRASPSASTFAPMAPNAAPRSPAQTAPSAPAAPHTRAERVAITAPASRRVPTPTAESHAMGSLSVNADPPAMIALDGRPLGRTPFFARPVTAGRHRLSARAIDGSRSRDVVIQVPANGHVRINPFRGAASPR